MTIQALMVLREVGSNIDEFMSVEVDILNGMFPENKTRDIMRIVNSCNYFKPNEENYDFIDMFGYSHNSKFEIWELMENANEL